MKRGTIRAACTALGTILAALLLATPASALTDNRDVLHVRNNVSSGDYLVAWRNGITSINGCFGQAYNDTGGTTFRYSWRAEDENGNVLDYGPLNDVALPGDTSAWTIEPGAAWSQSIRPRVKVYVEYQAGQSWYYQHTVTMNPFDPVGTLYYSPKGSNENWPGC